MANTSATGGYLSPTTTTIDGLSFRRFIGTMLCGLSGLTASLVRPSWQEAPPPIPDIDITWVAFGITAQRADNSPYVEEKVSGLGADTQRHEEVDILVVSYGPECLSMQGEIREGLYLAQNRETLYLASIGLVGTSDIIHTPELINGRYFDRADMTITIRREVRRTYSVLNFVGVAGTIYANREITTLTRDWSA